MSYEFAELPPMHHEKRAMGTQRQLNHRRERYIGTGGQVANHPWPAEGVAFASYSWMYVSVAKGNHLNMRVCPCC